MLTQVMLAKNRLTTLLSGTLSVIVSFPQCRIFLSCIYIGEVYHKNPGENAGDSDMPQQSVLYKVLGLATVGNATKIGSLLLVECGQDE